MSQRGCKLCLFFSFLLKVQQTTIGSYKDQAFEQEAGNRGRTMFTGELWFVVKFLKQPEIKNKDVEMFWNMDKL